MFAVLVSSQPHSLFGCSFFASLAIVGHQVQQFNLIRNTGRMLILIAQLLSACFPDHTCSTQAAHPSYRLLPLSGTITEKRVPESATNPSAV